jgi:hypothetical protein
MDRVGVALRIVVAHPPVAPGTRFGVQDKLGALHDAASTSADSATFEIEVTAAPGGAGPNLLGPFAHGAPKARFLYLSHGGDSRSPWIKRIKVPLSSITWSLIDSAAGAALETGVDGRRAGSVTAVWRVAPKR